MLVGEPVTVYGDGETSRDFCFIANAVQAIYAQPLLKMRPRSTKSTTSPAENRSR